MIHLQAPQLPAGKHPIGKVRLRYTPAASHEDLAYAEPFYLDAVSDPGRVHLGRKEEVIERAYIFAVNEARKQAALAVDRGALDEAERLLFEAGKRLQNAQLRSDRLGKEYRSLEEYASSLRHNPRGEELRKVQKRAKYKAYLLEGC